MPNVVSLCTVTKCSEEVGLLKTIHREKTLPGWSRGNWQDKGKKPKNSLDDTFNPLLKVEILS